jgi:hypothetical protein
MLLALAHREGMCHGRAQGMSFRMEIEVRRGLFYARLPLLGELCWTALNGWRYARHGA